ncbi:MAG: 16S rRNA (cytidine(1402)-2'-O)-methyltransferase [Gemmatimonadetes bacterium]|nr:16S rRNA (cytidine(1402)-2'-O)-methyltransferase [Gemmatimonadota bacterium]
MPATGGSEPGDSRGTLYVVATPIGNLDDLSGRAVRVLADVDVVACEDTRHSRALLGRVGSLARRIAHHDHNERASAQGIVALLDGGESVALICDAGTPSISDPGMSVVELARENGHRIVAVPGPSAVIAALSVAGLPTDRFSFEGFLPSAAGKRRAKLRSLAQARRLFGGTTLVFYESPARLATTLEEIASILGAAEVALCRELTKVHEEVLRGTARELATRLCAQAPRGEAVLIVDTRGAMPPDPRSESAAELDSPWEPRARELLQAGVGEREAVRTLRREGVPKESARSAVAAAKTRPAGERA